MVFAAKLSSSIICWNHNGIILNIRFRIEGNTSGGPFGFVGEPFCLKTMLLLLGELLLFGRRQVMVWLIFLFPPFNCLVIARLVFAVNLAYFPRVDVVCAYVQMKGINVLLALIKTCI